MISDGTKRSLHTKDHRDFVEVQVLSVPTQHEGDRVPDFKFLMKGRVNYVNSSLLKYFNIS